MSLPHDLSDGFWRMLLVDHIAERTPITRSPDMAECKRVVAEYLAANPTSLSAALKAGSDTVNLNRVIEALDPPLVPWVRTRIPGLLTKPCGMYS